MKTLKKYEKSRSFWFLLIISSIFFLLRLPSLFEPYWYADEGIYQAVAILVNSGQDLYSGAWENKPPFLIIIYALLDSDQFLLRTLSLLFGLVSVWFFYFVAKKLFSNSFQAVVVSTTIYAIVFGTWIIEGNIANAENYMLLPILIGGFIILTENFKSKTRQIISFFSAGFLLSFAFLIKIVAVFDFLAFSFFLFINPAEKFEERLINKLIPFGVGFTIPVILTTAYFFFTDHFKEFTQAFLTANVGYVGVNNEFFIPQGLLILKASLLGLALLFIFWKRNKIRKEILFIVIWFALSLFNAFFSQRPYTHYLLMLLPSFSLMIGTLIAYKKERLILGTIAVLSFLLVAYNFEFKGELLNYYKNFIQFSANQKSAEEYQLFFDEDVPRDYEIARYIKINTERDEKVFIWGNNAGIYKLADRTPILRYTVAYHITGFPTGLTEMKEAIDQQKPKLIVIMPNVHEPYPFTLDGYNEKMILDGAIIYEKAF